MFEKAKWIAGEDFRRWRHPPHAEPSPSPYLVRDFDVGEGLACATLAVAGLGQAAYYLNGERFGGIHPTHQSTYAKSVIYNTFDLTPYLRVGKNRFGAVIGHVFLADPEYYFCMSLPRMIAELVLEYKDGRREVIASDGSFFAHGSPTLFSLRRCGERYDARLEIPAWSHPDTPLDGWQRAAICASPGGALRPTVCPPKCIAAEIEGREIAPGLFDFGEHLSGFVRLTLEGCESGEISLYYSEWLTDDGLHITQEGLQKGTHPPMLHRDVYLPRGEAGESFEPLFTYHGFRYVEVKGAHGPVRLTALKVHTDLRPLAAFTAEDATLTAIHRACHRSILACAQGAMLDCPQREQNEWTGDGMLTAEVVSMEFDSYDFYYEWMMKFCEDQHPSGGLPAIIPCRSNWPFNFANGLDWSSAIVHIPYYAFKYTGDERIARMMWEPMERAMDYFATRSDSCLMDFGVGDWVSLDPRCPIEITDTVYYRLDALMMAEMAEALGEDSARWQRLAEDIRRDFRAKYVKGGRLTDRTLTPLVAAVFSGMLEDGEIASHVEAAAEIVRRDGYAFRCGVHGLRMLFDVFGRYGYNDLVLRVLRNADAPGYAKAVADGLLTLPEEFDYRTEKCDTGKYPSLNHQFTAMVDGWFFRYVAGIRFEGFGYGTILIEPAILPSLTCFSAEVRGIRIVREGDRLTVTSPYPFRSPLSGEMRAYAAGEYSFAL